MPAIATANHVGCGNRDPTIWASCSIYFFSSEGVDSVAAGENSASTTALCAISFCLAAALTKYPRRLSSCSSVNVAGSPFQTWAGSCRSTNTLCSSCPISRRQCLTTPYCLSALASSIVCLSWSITVNHPSLGNSGGDDGHLLGLFFALRHDPCGFLRYPCREFRYPSIIFRDLASTHAHYGTRCPKCSHRFTSGANSWSTLMPASIRIVSDPATKTADP